MNIGDVVGLVETVIEDGVPIVSKVPALVTKLYKNVHDEVVADLHKLESNVQAVVSKEDNPQEALPPTGLHVTTDLTPPPTVEEQKSQAAVAAAQPAQAAPAAPSPELSDEEKAFSALSPEDQAAFMEWRAAQGGGSAAETTGTGSGEPTT